MDAKLRIKQLLEERKWSEYRLAKECGISQSVITNMFRRSNAPTLPTLELICSALNISLSQFFLEGDDPVSLTEDQKLLLSKWRTLTEEQKKAFLFLMDAI